MRIAFVAGLAGVLMLAPARAADTPSLGLGDPAPGLAVAEWVKGPAAPDFEAGHVYLIEFWATW